jgi:hypothetical protein
MLLNMKAVKGARGMLVCADIDGSEKMPLLIIGKVRGVKMLQAFKVLIR